MASSRGRLTAEWWMSCGGCNCENATAERTQAKAAETMRAAGWVNTSARGWVCPKCKDEVPRKYKASREQLKRETGA